MRQLATETRQVRLCESIVAQTRARPSSAVRDNRLQSLDRIQGKIRSVLRDISNLCNE